MVCGGLFLFSFGKKKFVLKKYKQCGSNHRPWRHQWSHLPPDYQPSIVLKVVQFIIYPILDNILPINFPKKGARMTTLTCSSAPGWWHLSTLLLNNFFWNALPVVEGGDNLPFKHVSLVNSAAFKLLPKLISLIFYLFFSQLYLR